VPAEDAHDFRSGAGRKIAKARVVDMGKVREVQSASL
jgi:hypothetical protein